LTFQITESETEDKELDVLLQKKKDSTAIRWHYN